jgi:hypothetical protein
MIYIYTYIRCNPGDTSDSPNAKPAALACGFIYTLNSRFIYRLLHTATVATVFQCVSVPPTSPSSTYNKVIWLAKEIEKNTTDPRLVDRGSVCCCSNCYNSAHWRSFGSPRRWWPSEWKCRPGSNRGSTGSEMFRGSVWRIQRFRVRGSFWDRTFQTFPDIFTLWKLVWTAQLLDAKSFSWYSLGCIQQSTWVPLKNLAVKLIPSEITWLLGMRTPGPGAHHLLNGQWSSSLLQSSWSLVNIAT